MLHPEVKATQHCLTYFRDYKNNPIGVLLAIREGNEIKFGWSRVGSKTNGQPKDKFNKQYGQFVALKRAQGLGYLKNLPKDMEIFAKHFTDEATAFLAKKVNKPT